MTKQMLANEIGRVSSVKLELVRLYGRNKVEAPHRLWIALFTKATWLGFRIFDQSGLGRIYKKKQPLNSVSVAIDMTRQNITIEHYPVETMPRQTTRKRFARSPPIVKTAGVPTTQTAFFVLPDLSELVSRPENNLKHPEKQGKKNSML